MTKSSRRGSRLGAAVLGVAVVIGGGTVIAFSGGSHAATASADFSALHQPASTGLPATVSQELAKQNPNGIELAAARQVVSDADGTVWIAPATNGDLCLVREPSGAAAQVPGHPDITLGVGASCIQAARAATQGILIGAPGGQYGVAPDGVTQVQATVKGTSIPLTLTSNGGFRIPADATSLMVGNVPPVDLTHRTP